ncbi:sulfatase family protein [Pseudonocardia sp. HH130630-07]|uniref:sulfatase family protein n=1 Tax=Pseudonocardia sp. HH130630-07 TaxID=1690815 RepID=UPI000814DF13|nr:sulfatase-like hydrolase/transferase [Pseudonocardia sp. HH130630-07]ANY07506.1 arylsulfatase [Pseudonocardia sp. HH130630-07]
MPDGRPNIVLIITDQQRFDSIAALGHEHVDTPNLDRLVSEGTALTNTYVAAPSCAPSRASLFTGLYPHTSGVLRNDEPWSHSWVEDLTGSGYRCTSIGKMHTYPYEAPVGFAERHVVENKDRAHPSLPFFLDQWDKALWIRGHEKPTRVTYRRRDDYADRLGAFEWELPEDLHADAFVGNLARHWLETYPGADDEPFFLQVGFPGPHPPYDPPPRHLEPYRDRPMPPAHATRADIDAQPEPLQALRREHLDNDHDAVVHLDDPTAEQEQRRRRHYYANVSLIDEQVGGLLDALERRGVLDDTVVVFTSDHGDALGDHGHSQKWTMYEPSVHVPLVFRGPGVAAGRRLDGLASLMDVGPTVLELAGLAPPVWMEAESLTPALRGERWEGRSHVFSEHARDGLLKGTELMTMVRDRRHKLVEFVDHPRGQLFDLETDPHEEHDLWSSPEHAPVREELRERTREWRAASALHTATWAARFR